MYIKLKSKRSLVIKTIKKRGKSIEGHCRFGPWAPIAKSTRPAQPSPAHGFFFKKIRPMGWAGLGPAYSELCSELFLSEENS